MPAGGAAYYLFVKRGSTLTIHEGDDVGASEGDLAVVDITLPEPDALYAFYLGVGSPNSNWMTARDLDLRATELVSCPDEGGSLADWCDCDCDGTASGDPAAPGADDPGCAGEDGDTACSISDPAPALGTLVVLALLLPWRRRSSRRS